MKSNSHKEIINKMVTHEEKNTLMNHFLTNFKNINNVFADRNKNQYILWTRNNWVSFFYPIFKIDFDRDDKIYKINIKLNSFGKVIRFVIGAFWLILLGYLLFSFFIEKFDYIYGIRIVILCIVSTILYVLLLKVYRIECEIMLNQLKIIVGLETEENLERIENDKKEWTFWKILLRLFMYPFSIFILLISIWYITKGGFGGIFGVFVCTAYLYTDIKVLLDKRKRRIENK